MVLVGIFWLSVGENTCVSDFQNISLAIEKLEWNFFEKIKVTLSIFAYELLWLLLAPKWLKIGFQGLVREQKRKILVPWYVLESRQV